MSNGVGTGGPQPLLKNIRVYCECHRSFSESTFLTMVFCCSGLAFVVYWGIILFGYDTGIGGGVVNAPYFQQYYGLIDENGNADKDKTDAVSSLVVSVLQAGAFFGALGSAPLSGMSQETPFASPRAVSPTLAPTPPPFPHMSMY